jgi:peptidoglycan-associated lipoprotein
MALVFVLALAACKSTPEAQPEPAPEPEPTPPPVETKAAPDPRDYTDARNFDNPESLLSKRVIYFDFDKSTVRPEFRGIVTAHAAYMAANTSARVTLEGHADERGTREYNLGLGERRGNQLTTVSYGEERPTCRVSDEDCWAMNRRVEIVYTAR